MSPPKATLYEHVAHPHVPRNANDLHQIAQATGTPFERLNTAIALRATAILSAMVTFYAFLLLAFTGFPGIPWLMCSPQAFTSWLSSQTLQLIALPLLGAATVVVEKRQKHMADEQYKATMKTLHDAEQNKLHMNAQDVAIIAVQGDVTKLHESNDALHAKVDALTAHLANELDAHATLTAQVLTRLPEPKNPTPAPVKAPRRKGTQADPPDLPPLVITAEGVAS